MRQGGDVGIWVVLWWFAVFLGVCGGFLSCLVVGFYFLWGRLFVFCWCVGWFVVAGLIRVVDAGFGDELVSCWCWVVLGLGLVCWCCVVRGVVGSFFWG